MLDTGIGITEEQAQKLFKPFTKLDSGKHMNPNGIGLGLSICKKICENLGGEIKVRPNTLQQGGSEFSFTMKVMKIDIETDGTPESKPKNELADVNALDQSRLTLTEEKSNSKLNATA